jgi:aminopeptidase N
MATARIALAPSTTKLGASFEIGDLTIMSVTSDAGPLNFEVTGPQLDVGVPAGSTPAELTIAYQFAEHENFDGWMPEPMLTFLWPYFCGNLFPCKSDPADGVEFTMTVTGTPDGATAVYPAVIPSEAPSYMPAIAIGAFTKVDLAPTTKGTQISVWHLPGQEADAAMGTAHLSEVFDFFETRYGDYTFGTSVGTVSADWGGGDYGGMEHHPYWHVSSGSLYSEEVNAHEAAHGWFGNGVRIACWEDFVLSEGTVTYMAAHGLEQSGVDLWPSYECELKSLCDPATGSNTIALPDTCNAIDILTDPLWSIVPYIKGAYFFRSVADSIGADLLDQAIGEFYVANVGKPAKMQALIDHIKVTAGPAAEPVIDAIATSWLRTLECPVDHTTLVCP